MIEFAHTLRQKGFKLQLHWFVFAVNWLGTQGGQFALLQVTVRHWTWLAPKYGCCAVGVALFGILLSVTVYNRRGAP